MKIGNLEVYGVIYKATNKKNNKVYIGQTILGFNRRYDRGGIELSEKLYYYHLKNKNDGIYYNRHLLSSMIKNGIENFEVNPTLDFAFSKEELDIKEDAWIRYYNSVNNGYNEKYGGAHGKLSDVTKIKMSSQRRGEMNGMYGKKHTENAKKSMRKNHWSKTGVYKPKVLKGEMHPCYGRKHTEETKEKIRSGNLGKIVSEETKRKLSEGRKGVDNPTARAVICINFQEVFNTVTEASIKYGFDNSGLSACCRGKQKFKGIYNGEKLIWMYLDDWNKLSIEDKKKKYIDGKIFSLITGKIICETTSEIFDTVNDASKKYDLDRHRLSKKCKENGSYGSYDGNKLIWSKYDDYIIKKYGSLEAFIKVSFIIL